MNFNPLTLIPGFVFGVAGWAIFQTGRKKINYGLVFSGLALMIYPYFVYDLTWNWVIGITLLGVSYFVR